MALQINKVKSVTRTLFKLQQDHKYYFKLVGPIELGKELKGQKPDADGQKRKPAKLVPVIEMESGEEGQIIVGSVLESTLDEEYPGQKYIGKVFEIVQHAIKDGASSRYRTFSVTEVEVTGEADKPAKTDVDPAPKAETNAKK